MFLRKFRRYQISTQFFLSCFFYHGLGCVLYDVRITITITIFTLINIATNVITITVTKIAMIIILAEILSITMTVISKVNIRVIYIVSFNINIIAIAVGEIYIRIIEMFSLLFL